MSEIKSYTVVKCIQGYICSEDNVEYIVGNDYLILNESKSNLVNVTTIGKSKRYSDDRLERLSSTFVFDSTIYDAPQFDKHFKIVGTLLNKKLISVNKVDFNLQDICISNDYNVNNKKHFGDSEELVNSVSYQLLNDNSIQVVSKSSYTESLKYSNYETIYFDSISIPNNELINTVSFSIDENHVPTKFSKHIKSLTISGGQLFHRTNSRNELTKFTFNKADQLHSLNRNASMILDVNKLDNIEELYVSYAFIDRVTTKSITKLQDCHIKNLTILDDHNVSVFNCYIVECNKRMLSKKLYDSEYTLNIIELDADKYLVSNMTDTLSRKQFTEYSMLFEYDDCIEFFGLDINEVHELSLKCTINEYSNDHRAVLSSFSYGSNESKLFLYISKCESMRLMDKVRFSDQLKFSEEHALILDKNNKVKLVCTEYSMGKSYSRIDFDRKLVNDKLITRLTKSLDNQLLFDQFYSDFFSEPQIALSKHIGEISIHDFSFSMMPYSELIVSLKLVSDKAGKTKIWYVNRYGSYTRASYAGGSRHLVESTELFSAEIDWANYAFSIKTDDCNLGTYFNQSYKHYDREVVETSHYSSKNKIKLDQFYLINNPTTQLLFNESHQYRIQLTESILANQNILMLDDYAYFRNIDNKQFDEYAFLGSKNSRSCNISDAEKLARKYGFKLSIDEVHGDSYSPIKSMLSAKCDAKDRENLKLSDSYISDKLYLLGMSIDSIYNKSSYSNGYWRSSTCVSIQSILAYATKFRTKINMNIDVRSAFNVIVLIDNRYILINNDLGYYELTVNNDNTDIKYSEIKAYDIEQLLVNSDGKFSVVNFDIPDRLFHKVIDLVEPFDGKVLQHNQQFVLAKQFGCTGLHAMIALGSLNEQFIIQTDDRHYIGLLYSDNETAKRKLISIGTELRKYLLESIKKSIVLDTECINIIDYDISMSFLTSK